MAYDANMITGDWYKRHDSNCTGIIYVHGVYGKLKTDVPKIQIQIPKIFKTYVHGKEFSTLFKNLKFFTKAAPRIIGDLTIEVIAVNTNQVEFFLDDIKSFSDDEPPFEWNLETSSGSHTLTVKASNEYNISIDIIDFYNII